MHAERDHLIKVVFPALRARCRERGWDLVDIDLRWGIPSEEQDKALELCLLEIERCRPFFVGMLGERYGWVPSSYRVPDDGVFDWVLSERPREHSITALEILQGVLRNPKMRKHAFFYFRDPAFLEDPRFRSEVPHRRPGERTEASRQEDFIEEDLTSAAKLEKLKEAIRGSDFSVMDGYPCAYDGLDAKGRVKLGGLAAPEGAGGQERLATFGDCVSADLWKAIEQELPKETLDELERERRLHAVFQRHRAAHHVGRESDRQALSEYVRGAETVPLVLTGESGSGKSALLAAWCQQFAASDPEALVAAHFVGASPASTRADRTMEFLFRHLGRELGLPEEFPKDPKEMPGAFAKRLAEAGAKRRVVLVLDALNQLDPAEDSHRLTWLPAELPPGVRLVASTLAGVALDVLRARGTTVREIGPLGDDDHREIARQYLRHYNKQLSERPGSGVTAREGSTAGAQSGGASQLDLLDFFHMPRPRRPPHRGGRSGRARLLPRDPRVSRVVATPKGRGFRPPAAEAESTASGEPPQPPLVWPLSMTARSSAPQGGDPEKRGNQWMASARPRNLRTSHALQFAGSEVRNAPAHRAAVRGLAVADYVSRMQVRTRTTKMGCRAFASGLCRVAFVRPDDNSVLSSHDLQAAWRRSLSQARSSSLPKGSTPEVSRAASPTRCRLAGRTTDARRSCVRQGASVVSGPAIAIGLPGHFRRMPGSIPCSRSPARRAARPCSESRTRTDSWRSHRESEDLPLLRREMSWQPATLPRLQHRAAGKCRRTIGSATAESARPGRSQSGATACIASRSEGAVPCRRHQPDQRPVCGWVPRAHVLLVARPARAALRMPGVPSRPVAAGQCTRHPPLPGAGLLRVVAHALPGFGSRGPERGKVLVWSVCD
ncbi:MAG: NACHT domain-containing protein [Candidatus Riflebacteria bacterium]|nr:NACHT domain-containing protein [Candidatus Riflebacteria bacterium]